RARFSCGAEPGDLPYATTPFYQDDAGTYYFPTGTAGEYYTFTDAQTCLNPLRSMLFKLDDRESSDPGEWIPTAPPGNTKLIPLSCGSAPTSDDGPYHLWYVSDFSVPSGMYFVLESNENNKKAYVPIYGLNGQSISGDPSGYTLTTGLGLLN